VISCTPFFSIKGVFLPQPNPSDLFYLPPLCLPWSSPFSLTLHLGTQHLSLGHHPYLSSKRDRTITPYLLLPDFPTTFNPSMFNNSSVFFLSISFASHIVPATAVWPRIDTSFSIKHRVSLPYSIADLTHARYRLFLSSSVRTFSRKKFPALSEFHPSKSCSSWCYRFTPSTSIQSGAQVTETIHRFYLIAQLSTGSAVVSKTLLHQAQTKLFSTLGVTLWIFAHLPWTHFLQFVHRIKLAAIFTLFPHTRHGSILLFAVSPSDPLTIAFVFPRLTLISLLQWFSTWSRWTTGGSKNHW